MIWVLTQINCPVLGGIGMYEEVLSFTNSRCMVLFFCFPVFPYESSHRQSSVHIAEQCTSDVIVPHVTSSHKERLSLTGVGGRLNRPNIAELPAGILVDTVAGRPGASQGHRCTTELKHRTARRSSTPSTSQSRGHHRSV